MDLWPWRSKGSIWSLFSHRSSCTLNNGRKQHNENSNTSFQNCYYIYHLIYTLWRGHFLFWVPRKTYFWTWNTSSSFLTLWKIKKKGYSSETHNMCIVKPEETYSSASISRAAWASIWSWLSLWLKEREGDWHYDAHCTGSNQLNGSKLDLNALS